MRTVATTSRADAILLRPHAMQETDLDRLVDAQLASELYAGLGIDVASGDSDSDSDNDDGANTGSDNDGDGDDVYADMPPLVPLYSVAVAADVDDSVTVGGVRRALKRAGRGAGVLGVETNPKDYVVTSLEPRAKNLATAVVTAALAMRSDHVWDEALFAQKLKLYLAQRPGMAATNLKRFVTLARAIALPVQEWGAQDGRAPPKSRLRSAGKRAGVVARQTESYSVESVLIYHLIHAVYEMVAGAARFGSERRLARLLTYATKGGRGRLAPPLALSPEERTSAYAVLRRVFVQRFIANLRVTMRERGLTTPADLVIVATSVIGALRDSFVAAASAPASAMPSASAPSATPAAQPSAAAPKTEAPPPKTEAAAAAQSQAPAQSQAASPSWKSGSKTQALVQPSAAAAAKPSAIATATATAPGATSGERPVPPPQAPPLPPSRSIVMGMARAPKTTPAAAAAATAAGTSGSSLKSSVGKSQGVASVPQSAASALSSAVAGRRDSIAGKPVTKARTAADLTVALNAASPASTIVIEVTNGACTGASAADCAKLSALVAEETGKPGYTFIVVPTSKGGEAAALAAGTLGVAATAKFPVFLFGTRSDKAPATFVEERERRLERPTIDELEAAFSGGFGTGAELGTAGPQVALASIQAMFLGLGI